uniref:cellulose binding domain-containing protein n=1 Tax=Herbidospora sakaeratensis TaxID=564415 RepID=UPI000A025F41
MTTRCCSAAATRSRPHRPEHGLAVPGPGQVHGDDRDDGQLTVRWTWPGSQTITSLWNGRRSVSGSGVTVVNAPSNGSISASGSRNFGFTANGTVATPTATCTTRGSSGRSRGEVNRPSR